MGKQYVKPVFTFKTKTHLLVSPKDKLLFEMVKKMQQLSFIPTHKQVSYKVQRIVAGDGDSVQGGDGQVLHPQQLLQHPDQSTEDAEVSRSAVGHQLVVTLERHTHTHSHRSFTNTAIQYVINCNIIQTSDPNAPVCVFTVS